MPDYPVGIIFCGNSGRNGWSFHPKIRKKLIEDHQGKSILHLFGGASTFGVRMDIDPLTQPDVLGDAWLPPFACRSFDVVILDPPYFHLNAQTKTALFRAAGYIARERVVWWHTVYASGSGGLQVEASWLVKTGDSCHVRALQYFRIKDRPGPVKHFLRGPAMKYNRWLAGQLTLPGAEQVATAALRVRR